MALDPFTALSLAGNVVQFLGFAGSIISTGHELYFSPNGTLAEHADFGVVTNDLINLNNRLRRSLSGTSAARTRGGNEQALEELVSGCVGVAQELLAALDQLP